MKKQNSFHAQLAIEFILILAITLSFIILWLPAIITTKNSTQSAINDFYIKKTVEDISYTSDTLCILGAGNERELAIIVDKELNITSSAVDKEIIISDGISNISKQTKCSNRISIILEKGRTNIILRNENETIFVN